MTKCERIKGDPSSLVLVKIQLTKILPPESIPPVVFNIIFKKYEHLKKKHKII